MKISRSVLSPINTLSQIINVAFSCKNKKRKSCMRLLKSILNLASNRGFKGKQVFINHFKEHNTKERSSYIKIKKLLAYIDSNEVIAFAKSLPV